MTTWRAPFFSMGAATLLFALSGCAGPKTYLASDDEPWLVYERTPCFGPCPTFELEVDRTGVARFHGRRNVKPEGNQVANWSEQDMQAVADAAHAVNFRTKTGRYDNPLVTDLPSKHIRLAGHDVVDRFEGPDIEALYSVLDSLIETTEWIPTGH
jgi:hypothetical protein